MSGPLRIVPPPTPDEEAKAKVIEMLEEALKDAKRGEIVELLMILKLEGEEWDERATPTRYMSAWIGKLEILKFTWLKQYLSLYENEED